ncbi:hypothetical protein [Burkholderia sp. BCC0397]|uniref:hypothetical protein n=1 Tax=Burkholderia sp. BCC0397 TaxID=486876 RepID=UPI0015885349|nr:hypothetical protein [Burkholderia sp. BCC0397]
MLRTAVLQRQESATRVGTLAGLLSGSLRKSYLSEMSVSNFFSLGQTKFRYAGGGRSQLPGKSYGMRMELVNVGFDVLAGYAQDGGTSIGFHETA